jgi:1-acyl-sn-glycerol-3-phosphate acyltransferase
MMVTLRSLLFFAGFTASILLFSLPLSLIGWILPFRLKSHIGKGWGLLNLWMLKKLCDLDYRVEGTENFPDRNCIVMAKHQSAWETIALRAVLPVEHTWVLKRELMWIPFFGWAIAPYQPIAIDRKSGRKAVRQLIEQGRYWLGRGRWVVIFPEGTRVAPGKRKKYGMGGALLAERSGYSVVPIAHNAGVFWRRRDLKKYPGIINMVVGKPISSEGLNATEINRKVEDWIESTVARLPQSRATRPGSLPQGHRSR